MAMTVSCVGGWTIPVLMVTVSVFIALASVASAQVPASWGSSVCIAPAADSTGSASVTWSFGVWFAGGTHEPLKTREGHKEDRALYLGGIQAARPILRSSFGMLTYTPALIPAIVATANRDYTQIAYPDGRSGTIVSKSTAFGAGLVPIALEATLYISDRSGLVVGGGGGAAYFDRRIPDPAETRFNFLANGHAGLYFRSGVGTTTIGFWLQHISNGNTGKVNPGMDSRMLYVELAR